MRLLIADDNENIHTDFKKVLEPKDNDDLHTEMALLGLSVPNNPAREAEVHYRIDCALQGETAVEMVAKAEAENDPYGLVFMDVRMPPGIDGIQAISRIWESYPHTEVAICTAYADYTWEEIIKEVGITERLSFIRKPFNRITIRQLALSRMKKLERAAQTRDYIKNLEAFQQVPRNQVLLLRVPPPARTPFKQYLTWFDLYATRMGIPASGWVREFEAGLEWVLNPSNPDHGAALLALARKYLVLSATHDGDAELAAHDRAGQARQLKHLHQELKILNLHLRPAEGSGAWPTLHGGGQVVELQLNPVIPN